MVKLMKGKEKSCNAPNPFKHGLSLTTDPYDCCGHRSGCGCCGWLTVTACLVSGQVPATHLIHLTHRSGGMANASQSAGHRHP